MGRGLTSVDVCKVTGYSRDELHAILRCLWPYCEQHLAPRVAREFHAKDLLTLCVTCVLEHDLGLRRTTVATLGRPLLKALTGPRKLNANARLVVTANPPDVVYVAQSSTDRQGVVVALGPLFDRVDRYLADDIHPSLRLEIAISSTSTKRRHA
jgi:hypothetical protein